MGIIGLSILVAILALLNIILPPIWDKAQFEKYPITWEIDSLPIKENYNNSIDYKKTKEQYPHTYKEKKKANVIVDINTSSAEEFQAVKGIGSVFSQRIVKYRDALGGFHDKNQIKEVFGINDSIYNVISNQLVVKKNNVKKLNFNTAIFEELKRHPYISDQLAKQIISFREKVKPFASEEDVKKLYLMKDELYEKLKYYIEF